MTLPKCQCTLIFDVLLATFAQWLTSITLVRLSLCQVKRFSQCPPLAYQSFRSFWSFPTNSIWDLFYAPTCKTDCLQILYKFCKNWISVPNIVHQLTLSLRCKYCKLHSRSNFQDAINSIRRSAAERLQANDVSLIWRHSSWVRSRTLEHAYKRPLLTVFWGIWTPKCCRPSCGPPKGTSLRHNACFEPSCVKFHARVTSVGESGEKNKKERPYISRICPDVPLRRLAQILGSSFVSWT